MQRGRAILIGASSGIGAALARALCQRGFTTALLARRRDKLEALAASIGESGAPGVPRVWVHDARRVEQVDALFDEIVGEIHGLNLLVYAAGVMPRVELDEFDTAKDREIVETNLVGAVAWLNAGARYLGLQRAGTLVGISSMAGERGRPGAPAYGASKAGLNSFLESLRNRLARHGVRVLCVKPGFVATAMLEGVERTFWVSSPERAAEQILTAVEKGREEIFVGPRWRLVSWILRLLPRAVMKRVSF